MQKQMKNRISITLADEGVVRRIGDAFNPIELVAFQVRRPGVLLAGYNMSEEPGDSDLVLRIITDSKRILRLGVDISNGRDQAV
jgi:hypothetical protein